MKNAPLKDATMSGAVGRSILYEREMPAMLATNPIPHPPIRIFIGERVKSLPISAGITRNEKTCRMPASWTELTRTKAKLRKNRNSQKGPLLSS
jgi:hypothetical protein